MAKKAKRKASGKAAKKTAKKTAKKKSPKKKTAARKTKAARKKAPAKKAAARKAAPAKKKAVKKKKQIKGEGDYAATRAFDKDQAGFVKKNKARIPAMGQAAEKALEGPEGDSLRAAEAEAAARSRDTF